MLFVLFFLFGSPPLAREGQMFLWRNIYDHRITPACAGRTYALEVFEVQKGDYPRVCGNDVEFVKSLYLKPGSPPRVRERLIKSLFVKRVLGITPACAGRTQVFILPNFHSKDHPRMCGKYAKILSLSLSPLGSPPLAREGHFHELSECLCRRITPARAREGHQAISSACSKPRITPARAGRTESL